MIAAPPPAAAVARVAVLGLVVATLAGCYTSGPHAVPGVRFDGTDYRELFMRGVVVPDGARRSIGEIEGTVGGIQIAVPTVYAADGLDPTQVIFVGIPPTTDGPAVLDAFVSSMVDSGNKPWPDGLCRYLKPGWVDPGVPLPCAPPGEIEFGGTMYRESGFPFEFADGDLTPLGPFDFSDDLPADGLGTTAFRITDLPADQAVAVAQGPDTYRVYVPLKSDFLTELCPYMAVPYKECDVEMVRGSAL